MVRKAENALYQVQGFQKLFPHAHLKSANVWLEDKNDKFKTLTCIRIT